MNNSIIPDESHIRNSRLKLIAIILIFTGPLAFAFIWYYGLGAKFAPEGQANNSPLIDPAVAIVEFENPMDKGGVYGLADFERKWTIVHLVDGSCSELCEKSLYNTRQTRLAVGKDIKRVKRIVLITESMDTMDIAGTHYDATIVVQNGTGLDAQIRQLLEANKATVNDAILVDPLGNAMMLIPVDLNPSLLLKDLKKLLKLSRIG